MNPKYHLRVVQYGQAQQPHTLRAGVGREGKALVLHAQSGMRFQLMDAMTQEAPVKLHVVRQGRDLLVTLPDGDVGAPDIIIRGYFDAQDVAVMGRSASGDWRVYDNSALFSLSQSNGIGEGSLRNGQVSTVSLATPPGSGWFEGEKGWMFIGAGTLGVVAGLSSLSKDSGLSAFEKIKAYAQHAANAATPTVTDFGNAGIKHVDANNVASINAALQVTQLDMSNSGNVQKIVDSYVKILGEANGLGPDLTPDADPTADDYQNIGVLLGSVRGNANALTLLNDAIKGLTTDSVDTVTELKAMVAVVQKVMSIVAGVAPATALSTDDLVLLGVRQQQLDTLHVRDNLSSIVSAIGSTAADGSGVSSVAKLLTLMTAYDKILNEANGATPDADLGNNPRLADFTAIGATLGNAAKSSVALNMLVDVIGEQQRSAVDTVEKINDLAAVLDKLATLAAAPSGDTSAPTLTAAEYAKLGLSGFSGSGVNNQAVANLLNEAVRNLEPHDVDSLSELQSQAALQMLRVWAKDLSPTKTAATPTADDYNRLGVVRSDVLDTTVALTAADATTLNLFIDNMSDAQIDSTGEIQHLAAAVFRLLNEANGTNSDGNTAVNPLATDYVALGVTGRAGNPADALHGNAAQLLTDVISTKTSDLVDTPREVNTLASLVDRVLDIATGRGQVVSLSQADYTTLGVVGVTTNNLTLVSNLVQGAARDGSGADSLAELQSLVSLARVVRYADDASVSTGASNEGGLPTLADYKGILTIQSIVVPANVNAYNNALSLRIGSQVDDPVTELLPLIRGYNTVLAVAAGSASPTALNLADVAALGVTGVSAANLPRIGALIQATSQDGSAVDTVPELQSVVSLARVVHYADDANVATGGTNAGGLPTLADYKAIAAIQSSVLAANVDAYNNAVDARLGSQLDDATTELLPLIRAYNNVLAVAAGSASPGSISLADYTALGISSVTSGTLTTLGNFIQATARDGSGVDTVAEIQSLVGLARVVRYADDANVGPGGSNVGGLPTLADYRSISAIQPSVSSANVAAYNSAVEFRTGVQLDDASVELLPLIRAYNNVLAVAARSSSANALTLEDLSALGVTGGTNGNLATLAGLIQATPADGSAVDTIAELQSVTSLARVVRFADDDAVNSGGSNEGGLPTLADYRAILAVQSLVVANNINAYNSAVSAHAGAQLDDATAELLPLVRGYNAILAQANGSAADPVTGTPTRTDYDGVGLTLGAVGTVPAARVLALMNEAVGAKLSTDVDTLAELEAIAAAANKVMGLAAINKTSGASDADSASVGGFSASDLQLLGLDVSLLTQTSVSSTVRAHRLADLRDRIVYSDDTGLSVEHLAQLQAMINATAVIVT